MKTSEFVGEGISDILGKLKSGISGARASWQASQQKRSAAKLDRDMADILHHEWNTELVKHPNIDPKDIPQLVINFLKKKFHDKPTMKYPPLTGTRDKDIYNYLATRLKDYYSIADVNVPEPVTQLKTGFANPKTDVSIDLMGNEYSFRANLGQWFDNTGEQITNQRDIQTLNRKYYDIMLRARSKPNPDDDGPPEPPGSPSPAKKKPRSRQSTKASPQQGRLSLVSTGTQGKSPGVTEGKLFEGGNAIPTSEEVNQEDVKTVVDIAKRQLPKELLRNLEVDIGSAGFKKIPSGDVDLMVEADDVISLFRTHGETDPVYSAKKMLEKYFLAKGIEANTKGRNVHIGIPYKQKSTSKVKIAQVDIMVIDEVKYVAPWHQHGPRGMYKDLDFKGSSIFVLISSIAKPLGLKFDPFSAKLIDRETGKVVARTRDQVAKILFNPTPAEKGDALNSVKSIMKALEKDPDREIKLAQARDDANKGIIKLPESIDPGSPAWFRSISDKI